MAPVNPLDVTTAPGAVLLLGLALLAVGLLLWGMVSQDRRRLGLPPRSDVVYSDTDRPAAPLYSQRLGLTGKPDYIIRERGCLVPVEVKSGGARWPRHGHVLQLIAYGVLLEEKQGSSVPHGYLVYRRNPQPFLIEFTPELKKEVFEVVERIRQDRGAQRVLRNHEAPQRCQACSYFYACDQRLPP